MTGITINPQSRWGVLAWTVVWPVIALLSWPWMLVDALIGLVRGGVNFNFVLDFQSVRPKGGKDA